MKTRSWTIPGYERVIGCELAENILSIIAIHNTKRGPALGGVRFYPYKSEQEALTDACRLAEAMTYKAAMADLALGGGKAVIVGDPAKVKTKQVLEAFGDFVESLKGAYITAKDVGITVDDLGVIAQKTKSVTGYNRKIRRGDPCDRPSSGDPSPMTGYGVFQGIKAACKFVYHSDSLVDKTILVQGLGRVGWEVTKHLITHKATVVATDINEKTLAQAKNELGIQTVEASRIDSMMGDIFCPCAMGASVYARNIIRLKEHNVRIIAGGANNQLANEERDGNLLHQNQILYAPDYVINAGGLINIACELDGIYDPKKAKQMTEKIYPTLLEIFQRSKTENQPTATIAHQMAIEKMVLS